MSPASAARPQLLRTLPATEPHGYEPKCTAPSTCPPSPTAGTEMGSAAGSMGSAVFSRIPSPPAPAPGPLGEMEKRGPTSLDDATRVSRGHRAHKHRAQSCC